MAGLLGTALAGALAGGGQAVQHNAQSQIEQKRQEALKQMDHDLAMVRQEDQQEFTAGENDASRQHTSSENAADRQSRARIAANNQTAATNRTSMQINAGGWTLGTGKDGNPIRFNTRTGETAPLPEGVRPGGLMGGAMTEQQSALIQNRQSRIEAIDEQLYGDNSAMLSDEQKAQLELERSNYQAEIDRLLTAGGSSASGGSLLDDLANMRGGAAGNGNQGGGQGGASQPSLTEQANQRQQAQAEQQRSREIDETLDSIEAQVNRSGLPRNAAPNGLLGGAGVGSQPLTPDQRQAMMEQVQALEGELTPRQRAQALELIEQLQR